MVNMSASLCVVLNCGNVAADDIRYQGMCTDCFEQDCDLARDVHYCTRHACFTGEGDICGQCEAEFDVRRDNINAAIKANGGTLAVATVGSHTFKVPVYNFDDAKMTFHSLDFNNIEVCVLHYNDGIDPQSYKFK